MRQTKKLVAGPDPGHPVLPPRGLPRRVTCSLVSPGLSEAGSGAQAVSM